MAITRAEFPLPDVDDPLTAPFFAAAALDELAIPRCERCNQFVWYPKASCPRCASPSGREPQVSGGEGARLVWTAVSGRATLFTWTVVRRAFLPAFADRVPFVTALVALDEDPAVRVCTYLVDVDPDAPLVAGTPVAVTFRDLTFSTVPNHAVRVPMFAVVPSEP
ncbi:MAG TPA: OB-fold domain-containing protein, partial [Acidimicrobiia bacterium]